MISYLHPAGNDVIEKPFLETWKNFRKRVLAKITLEQYFNTPIYTEMLFDSIDKNMIEDTV